MTVFNDPILVLITVGYGEGVMTDHLGGCLLGQLMLSRMDHFKNVFPIFDDSSDSILWWDYKFSVHIIIVGVYIFFHKATVSDFRDIFNQVLLGVKISNNPAVSLCLMIESILKLYLQYKGFFCCKWFHIDQFLNQYYKQLGCLCPCACPIWSKGVV